MAERDNRLVGITPAMCEGSGMVEFSKRFPDRYYDVAIAEQHALTMAAGMACDGLKPVVAIYSTFLQRGYDQLIHDIALQNLDVTFGIDRAGLVGEDGPTHHGAFDLSYLRCIPNMVIGAPSDENECRQMLYTAYQYPGPAAIRYPRGTGPRALIADELVQMPIGKAREVRSGKQVAILNFGALLPHALLAANQLNATVVDMRWVKPMDTKIIETLADEYDLLVTLEDNAISGGAGSGVNQCLVEHHLLVGVLNLGIPDAFIEHGASEEQHAWIGLDGPGIERAIKAKLNSVASYAPTKEHLSL
jgi:1-deoxy-D-xylulose-5-phosphate synthase